MKNVLDKKIQKLKHRNKHRSKKKPKENQSKHRSKKKPKEKQSTTQNTINSNLLSNISHKKISEEFTDDDVFDQFFQPKYNKVICLKTKQGMITKNERAKLYSSALKDRSSV